MIIPELKVGDKIQSEYFKYVRHHGMISGRDSWSFDYKRYYYNEDGSWNKIVIPREQMSGEIKDCEDNATAIFEVVEKTHYDTTNHYDHIVYDEYRVRKIGDDSYPIITVDFVNISIWDFPGELVNIIENGN